MKSLILCGLGAWILLASPLHADDSKNSVKGGVGIGPIRIGADITEIEKLYGKTSDIVNFGPGARVWFVKSENGKEDEVIVTIRRAEDGQHYTVRQVVVTSPDYRTPAGNSTRSDLAAIWREFPDLTRIEAGEALDGVPMEVYSSRSSGVGILVERPRDTPASDKPASGAPDGKCRALIVQAVNEDAQFEQLGIAPKKADAD